MAGIGLAKKRNDYLEHWIQNVTLQWQKEQGRSRKIKES